MKKIILFFVICFFLINIASLYSYTLHPVYDFYNISKSSVSYEKKDIFPLIGFAGVSALLFWQDSHITDSIQELKSPGLDKVMKYSKYFGDGWTILALSGLSIAAGETFFSRKYTILGIYMIEGVVISGIFVSAVKFLAGRARPYTDKGPYYFKPFPSKTAYTSFYSGHTTEAFTFASVISHFFKNAVVSSIVYSLAALTAMERVYDNKHWPSDVFIGGVTGILIGRQIVKLNKDYHQLSLDKENIKFSFKLMEF